MTEETSLIIPPPPWGTYTLSGEEITLEELGETLDSTIKHDTATKQIMFIIMLLNYTEEDQQNIACTGPTSVGKSHVALEVAKYFPEEDLMPLSYTSPTAFFHGESLLVDENLTQLQPRRDYVQERLETWEEENPRPKKGQGISEWKEALREEVRSLKEEWDKIVKYSLVDLERKIIIFLDQPHDDLLRKLRPLLSHDKKILPLKITDKTKEGGNRTKNIMLVGFPTVVFLSVNASLDGQETTRTFLLSPEVTQDKLKASIQQAANFLSDREEFRQHVNADKRRLKLMGRVQDIKDLNIKQIILYPADKAFITSKFIEEHNHLEPRHQRDFPRLIAIIKSLALLNCFNRERITSKLWATRRDCEEGYRLYRKINEANERGVPPHIYKFYEEKLRDFLSDEGLTRKETSRLYREYYRTRIGDKALKRIVAVLCEAGLVYEAKDPEDKRFVRIYPISDEIYVPQGGGENVKQVDEENPPNLTNFTKSPEEPPAFTIQEGIQFLTVGLRDAEKHQEGPVDQETLKSVLRWPELPKFEAILHVAERDRLIYQPRPGYWSVT